MKHRFSIALLFLLSACSLEQYNSDNVSITISSARAELSDNGQTKVFFSNGEGSLWWNAFDDIAVFSDTQDAQTWYNVNMPDGTAGAVFQGESVSGTEIYACYPGWSAKPVPESRYIRQWFLNSVASDTDPFLDSPMVARYQDGCFRFRQTCGILHLRIKGAHPIKSLVLSGNNGEFVSGQGIVDLRSDEPTFVLTGSGSDFTAYEYRNFDPDEPVDLQEDAVWNVYFPLPAMTFTKGFTVRLCYSESGEEYDAVKSTERAITISRGVMSGFPVIDLEELIYEIPDPDIPDGNIEFRDPVAKYACVEKFDTDSDGELSYREASMVTDIAGLFRDWETVSYFDELKYFIRVTSTEGVFEGLKYLKSITIPEHITTLGSFAGCTSLKEVYLPEGLKAIPEWTFWHCTSLETIELPSALEIIGDWSFYEDVSLRTLTFPESLKRIERAFGGCTGLESLSFPEGIILNGSFLDCTGLREINLPKNCKLDGAFVGCGSLTHITIPEGAELLEAFVGCSQLRDVVFESGAKSVGDATFRRCTSLEEFDFPEGISVYGKQIFDGCSALRRVHLPSGMTELGNYFFAGCVSLQEVNIPDSVTSLGNNVFEDCDMTGGGEGVSAIDIPESVKTLGQYPFGKIRHIILRSKSLVSIAENTFDTGTVRVYVPSSLVPMYKARTYWNLLSAYVYPIEEYPVTSPSPVMVDLGLPSGLLWADYNLGASFTDEPGDYYAWGEVSTKDEYTKDNYLWSSGEVEVNGFKYMLLSKYNSDETYGPVDGKTVLELEDDAAAVAYGSPWRMPTCEEMNELFQNCSVNRDGFRAGVPGLELTSKSNGNKLFLPATNGDRGRYWTSTVAGANCADWLYFSWYNASLGVPLILYLPGSQSGVCDRDYGLAVRPVCVQ